MELPRRSFVKGAALACGAAALTAMVGCSSSGQPGTKNEAESSDGAEKRADVVVLGGGIGGLAAALKAQADGASVIVIEAGSLPGGTVRYIRRVHISDFTSADEVLAKCPSADRALSGAMVEGFNSGFLPLMSEIGVPTEIEDTAMVFSPTPDRPREVLDFMAEYIIQQGGEIIYETKGVELITEEDVVTGAVLLDASGASSKVRAGAVVLATGGFAHNKGLVTQYLGSYADRSVGRCVPYNTGDGLLMGLSVGAQLSRSMGTIYGAPQVYPPVPFTNDIATYIEYEKDPNLLTGNLTTLQPVLVKALSVNTYGDRFVDEGRGSADNINSSIILQPKNIAAVIFDQPLFDENLSSSVAATEQQNDWQRYESYGATGLKKADTLEELVDSMFIDWGFSSNTLNTIMGYNEAVRSGNGASLRVPRTKDATPIETGPFYAIQMTTGISMTYGGLKIDSKAQVLGASDIPIKGLFASTGCAGGVYGGEYGGASGCAASFGYIAGASAADFIKQQSQ